MCEQDRVKDRARTAHSERKPMTEHDAIPFPRLEARQRRELREAIAERMLRRNLRNDRQTFYVNEMAFVASPGVFEPSANSAWFLAETALDIVPPGAHVLELGCGTGYLAVLLARAGRAVTCTDVNSAAVRNARLNARLHRVQLDTAVGDLFTPVFSRQFDAIVMNPPFFVANASSQIERAWNGGDTTRRLLTQARDHLRPEGFLLVFFADFGDEDVFHAAAASQRWSATPVRSLRVFVSSPTPVYTTFTAWRLTPAMGGVSCRNRD